MRRNISLRSVGTGMTVLFILSGFAGSSSLAYPPAVGIVSPATSCISCHADNGPWQDEGKLIIDLLDKASMESLKQPDGSFLIEMARGERQTVLTVIGWVKGDEAPPEKNGWLYVDLATIETDALSKFAAGWAVNLPLGCRVVGDSLAGYEGISITSAAMTVEPGDDAADAEVVLQVMLTKGEPTKGNPNEGMFANYFERIVVLKVRE